MSQQLTLKQMVDLLVEKGYSRQYAETIAPLDFDELNHPDYERRVPRESCSVCRGERMKAPCDKCPKVIEEN